MNGFTAALGIFSLLFGLGVAYLSRFLLRNYPHMTGSELKSLHSELEGVHRTYKVLNTVTVLSIGFLAFVIYQLNRTFWKERVVVLFVLVFAVLSLFDGLFALSTKVFPTTTRYNGNSFVYDEDDKLRWIAFWQIGLSAGNRLCAFGFNFVSPYEKSSPTQRAPDWWESARFQAVCVAWSRFRQSGVVSSRPPAGNASR